MTKPLSLRQRVKRGHKYTRKLHEARTAPAVFKPPRRTIGGYHGDHGVIVTLRNQRTGDLLVIHEPGKRLEALRRIASRIDASQLDLRVLCYSTPETIEGDLQGDRDVTEASPEVRALGSIGRRDLLDPQVAAKTNEKNGHY